MSLKIALHNLGCKVNEYEMEVIKSSLIRAGYMIVPFEAGADVYIINTCTVTNIADRKSRQMLHRARRMNPDALVVATGCYTEIAKEDADPVIDLIVANEKKSEIASMIRAALHQSKSEPCLPDLGDVMVAENRTRANIKVQDGCNQFCSYCIIPYARGRVRSVAKDRVIRESTRHAQAGCREVVLTGIHLSSYGRDLEGESLLTLISAVHEIKGIERIRLGSLEQGIITEDFARQLSRLTKVCPHFHLSLQSGSDTVLTRMNRHYTAEMYEKKCEILRQYFDNPAITTDIIVGFPQETEQEFNETKRFMKQIGFAEVHIFKYSRRGGTKAAVMDGQIMEHEKTRRSRILIEIGRALQLQYAESFLGKEVSVLFEETVQREGCIWWTGYTREYIRVFAKSDEHLSNVVKKCQIMDVFENIVVAKVLEK